MSEGLEKRSVAPEDLFRLKVLQDALLSPNGKKVVYGVSWTDAEKLEEYSNLWLLDLETGDSRQLTRGSWSDTGAAWSPDGTTIAFISTRKETTPQIFLIRVDGGEAHPLTEIKQGVGGGPFWSPDGKQVVYTAAAPREEKPDPKKPYRITRSVYRFDGAGYLDNVVHDIYIISAEGGEPEQLTRDRFHNDIQGWSPDGEEILYLAYMEPDSFNVEPHLRAVNLQGEVREILSESWGNIEAAAWMPNGKQILFVGDPKESKIGSNNEMYLVDARGGKPKTRSSRLKYSFCGALRSDLPKSWRAINHPLLLISKDGSAVYTTVHVGGSIHTYKVSLKGSESHQPIIAIDERPSVLMDTDEKHLLFAVSAPNHPCDLFIADMDGKNERQLTHLNDELASEWLLPRVERFTYRNQKRQQIEGWMMTPPTGEGPYPTILYIHGGPHSAFGSMYSFDYQMLAGAGYAVLYINPRGSSGYGSDFATTIIGDWGDPVFDDLMRGVDYAVKQGVADADMLGCYGLSYGGYMSCWIVGHTDRFKAAVPENPVSNLISFYGTSDIGPRFLKEEMGGLPHEIPEVYRKLSPITYAHNATTPTLMIQGEADYRCPAEQTEQFYTVLKASGCVAEMLRLPNSSHGGTIAGPVIVRKYANEAMLDWFDRHRKGEVKEQKEE
jgi:dipeptidyl aminopeptidase/acylaminoacyl peptidase